MIAGVIAGTSRTNNVVIRHQFSFKIIENDYFEIMKIQKIENTELIKTVIGEIYQLPAE